MSREQEINSLIDNFHPTNDQQVRNITNNLYNLIHEYELFLYENDAYDNIAIEKISNWRKLLSQKVGLYRAKSNDECKPKVSKIEETVTLVSRQISKADENTLGMERSSIKLKGLNYTSKDLQKEIAKTKKLLIKKRTTVEKEVLMIKFALLIFLTVCVAIIVDKISKK